MSKLNSSTSFRSSPGGAALTDASFAPLRDFSETRSVFDPIRAWWKIAGVSKVQQKLPMEEPLEVYWCNPGGQNGNPGFRLEDP
jgi:hypothetical protein